MTRREDAERLVVVECSGTGRSGKGTIASYLSETHKAVASDETGADYRAVTRHLLASSIIHESMSPEEISAKTREQGAEALAKIAAARRQIVDEHGFTSLYERDVNKVVADVSSEPDARIGVKAGIAKRIMGVRNDFDKKVLVVDGRNLAPIVEKVEGVDLVLRMFVHCTPEEGALRECARGNVDLDTPQGRAIFEETRAEIRRRNEKDASRNVDPVRPDPEALNYWDKPGAAVGALACMDRRQINFDTTPFRDLYPEDPRAAMLDAADSMFHVALAMSGVSVDSLH